MAHEEHEQEPHLGVYLCGIQSVGCGRDPSGEYLIFLGVASPDGGLRATLAITYDEARSLQVYLERHLDKADADRQAREGTRREGEEYQDGGVDF